VRHEITIPQTTSVLTDFPVYVDLGDLSATFWSAIESAAVATVQGSSIGGDIRVTQSDGETEVPFEPVSVDGATDSGELHFKATTSNVGTTTYYIYGGNSGATAYAKNAMYGAEEVWSNFVYVSHDGGPTDSTGNIVPSIAGTPTPTTGKLGGATDYDGIDDDISLGDINAIENNSPLFVSIWLNAHTFSYGSEWVTVLGDDVAGASNEFAIAIAATGSTFEHELYALVSGPGFEYFGILNTGAWYRIAVTWDSSQQSPHYFVNDTVIIDDSSSTTRVSSSAGWMVAQGRSGENFDGLIDEIRIAAVNPGDDWVNAEYDNHNSPATWYSLGTVETN
jgi:hypothetical protein